MNTSFALSGFQWRGVWGERTTSTPSRGYCANLGHPEDETGLVYMRARYYEPTTGRFVSEDPARDGGNWYLYADGDPVGKVDFTGNFPWAVLLMLGATALGFIFGMFIGYRTAVYLYNKQENTFGGGRWGELVSSLGVYSFLVVGTAEVGIAGWMSFKKIPGGLRCLGLAGFIGFIFGFMTGVLMASLDYERHQDFLEEMRF